MRKLILPLILFTASYAVAAQPIQLNGEPARALFKALVQADLKTTQINASVDPNAPSSGYEVVEQKVTIKNLGCKLAYTGVGTLTGNCTANDMDGKRVQMGSAASGQILNALPDGFADAAAGRFTANASSITCEIDARQSDPTGTAVANCSVQ